MSQLRKTVTTLFDEERIELPWVEAVEARLYAERLLQEAILSCNEQDNNMLLTLWMQSTTDQELCLGEKEAELSPAILELALFWLQKPRLIEKLFKHSLSVFSVLSPFHHIRCCLWFPNHSLSIRRYSNELFGVTPVLNAHDPEPKWNLISTQATYDPNLVEDPRLCRKLWNRLSVSKPETRLSQSPRAPIVSILLPPPNVTGSLHVGHALTCTVQDTLARCYRMQGSAVLWIPGMDHAGIATQMIVERELGKRAVRDGHTNPVTFNPRLKIGRNAFVEEVWKWKDAQTTRIREQLDCLGLSLDWDREYFTLSPKHSRAVTEAFVRLHEIGLIYRAASLVSWSCYLQSAISDIEVETRELHEATLISVPGYEQPQPFGIVDYFAYPLVHPSARRSGPFRCIFPVLHFKPMFHSKVDSHVVVATTRLETMLGDTALVVHPDDARYCHLIGQSVIHPFCPTGRHLPIIADADLVDPTKGTGVVKLSPGHSLIDWEVGKTHNLPILNMLDSAGRVTALGGEFVGLPRFTARQRLVERLSELGLYRKREDISLTGDVTVLPICSRSGDVIEPLVREQWFVRTTQIAEQATEPEDCKDRSKEITTDSNSTNMWVVARSVEEAAQLLNGVSSTQLVEQDPDVLDTWFSSALLPFSVLGWPDKTPDLERFYPMQLLETGQDILFFWVARMVMLGISLTRRIPFRQVLLHGLVCDATGQKMSKSKGNGIDPLDLIYGVGNLSRSAVGPNITALGADALRASLVACPLSQPQVAYSLESALDMRKFCNKSHIESKSLGCKDFVSGSQMSRFMKIETFTPNQANGLHPRIVVRQEQLFRFLGVVDRELELHQRMANLLDTVAHVNAWRPILRRVSDNTSPNHLCYLSHEANHSVHPDELEVLTSLTRISPMCDPSFMPAHNVCLPVAPKSRWSLIVDSEAFDLNWTERELEQRLHAQTKRREQLTHQLSQAISGQQLKTVHHKFRFLGVVDRELELHQRMANLLDTVAHVNAWRPILRRVSDNTSPNHLCYLSHEANHSVHPDELEVLTSLTRISPMCDPSFMPRTMSAYQWRRSLAGLLLLIQRFLGVVDRELELHQRMANLLDTVAHVNAWRPILRRVSDNTSPNHLCYLSHEANHSVHPDELEVLTSLTRISPMCDPSFMPAHNVCLPVAPKSRWSLIVDSEAFDLNWTERELEQRLHAQTKRREQLTHQLSQAISGQQLKTVHHKLESIKMRMASLDYQLGVIRRSQKTRT
ncbi:hypothetical protein AHF37_00834 [Paragonimus kellicotti]|nr:hypothetical protein AHF37_00834 [Paragonimus kellicotti]